MPSDPERQSPLPTVEIPEVVQNDKKADASDIVVDWEGPNDPLNPKKLVCRSIVLCLPKPLIFFSSTQLESSKEMGRDFGGFIVHPNLAGILKHDRTCEFPGRGGLWYHE
jgi:hypothetical protein